MFLTSQGSAHGRFTRAIHQRNLWAAEVALRELGRVSLEDALGYLDLLAQQQPEKLERAAVRWHGRLETEAPSLTQCAAIRFSWSVCPLLQQLDGWCAHLGR